MSKSFRKAYVGPSGTNYSDRFFKSEANRKMRREVKNILSHFDEEEDFVLPVMNEVSNEMFSFKAIKIYSGGVRRK